MSKPSILLVLVFLGCFITSATSQRVITTDSGKKIVINPDGTWSDYEEPATVEINKEDIAIESQLEFDNSEQDEYEILKSEILKRLDDVENRQKTNKSNIRNIKEEIKRAKKDGKDDLALKRLEEQKLQYYLGEYDIEKEMDAIKPFKLSVDRIDNQGFNSQMFQALKENFLAYTGGTFSLYPSSEPVSIDNTDVASGNDDSKTIIIEKPLTDAEIEARDIERELRYYSFDIDENDVLRNPPEAKCKVKLKGIDKRTRKERTELEADYLFGYTHPNIKSYFKENDFLTCYAKLSKVGGFHYLSLEVRIASIKANKTYGALDKGAPIRIKLLNGETVNLYNLTAATGFIEPITGVTVYQTNYPMEKGEYKQLSKTELDKIGLIWSTGYEEYEIYEVDFLINQAKCLKNS